MAAPNILSLSNIAGKSTSVSLGSTTLTDVLVNSSGSNKVLKVNTVRATNTDGTVSHDISCLLYTSPSPRDAHESRMPSSA